VEPASRPDPAPPASSTGSAPDRLRELVAACIERWEAEGAAALDALCREQPDLAAKLRRRVERLAALGMLRSGAPLPELPPRMGDFVLLERLGEGGMGVVHLAEQRSLGRRVALKLIRPELLHFGRTRERFRREIEAIARLHHPGIVTIHAVGEEGGLPWYAMEHVAGATLAEALQPLRGRDPATLRGSDLAEAVAAKAAARATQPAEPGTDGGASWLYEGTWEETCLRLVRQVADALDHAHRRGILHRDVKPSNVMLTSTGRVLLLDFGLALADSDERFTQSQSWLGSLPYAPPEQLRGDHAAIDARSDVYALGVTLYELLTLRLPHGGKSVEETARAIEVGRVEAPSARNRAVSWEAETVCLTAMEGALARRYASAADLARDLDNVLQRRPIDARRPSAWLRARRWVQRHPGRAAALLFGGLLVVAAPTIWAVAEKRKQSALKSAFERETGLRRESDRQRERADGLRLAARAQSLAGHDPTLALLLAIEGAQRTPSALANDALLAALDACHEEAALHDPESDCVDVRFSPDGALLATAGSKGVTRLWSVATHEVVADLSAHDTPVSGVAFAPDGARVATAGGDRVVRVWRVADGAELAQLRGFAAPVRGVEWLDDERLVAWGGDATVRVGTADGAPLRTIELLVDGKPAQPQMARLHADGRTLAVATDRGAALVLDVESGELRGVFAGHKGALTAVDLHPLQRLLLTAGRDGSARLFDLDTGRQLREWRGHHDVIYDARFAPDGSGCATIGGDHQLVFWSLSGDEPRLRVNAGWRGLLALGFSPGSDVVAVGGRDESTRLFRVADGALLSTFTVHERSVRSVVFSPDGSRLATATWDAHLWRAPPSAQRREWEGHRDDLTWMTLGEDGSRWFSLAQDGTAVQWDAASGRRLATYHHERAFPTWLAASADGKHVATIASDERVRVFAARSGAQLKSFTPGGELRAIAFSPDGSLLAVDGPDFAPRLWEWQQGKLVASVAKEVKRHGSSISVLAFDHAGARLVSGGNDDLAIVWSVPGLARIAQLGGKGSTPDELSGHHDDVRVVGWSRDDRVVATGSYDNTVGLWDPATGEPRRLFPAQEFAITSLDFSPDDQWIATSGYDGRGNVWSAATGERRMSLSGFDAIVWSARFAPDGRSVTALAANGALRSFPLDPLADALRRRPREFTAEERRQHELDGAADWIAATSLVDGLAANAVRVADVVAAIERDAALAPGVRAAALALARDRRDSPQDLSRQAWGSVRAPGASKAALALARARAEEAVRLAPTAVDHRRSLAVACLRTGDLERARAILSEPDVLEVAGDLLETLASHAYLSLAEWRLGHEEAARAALARAKELRTTIAAAGDPWWADYFLAEPLATVKE